MLVLPERALIFVDGRYTVQVRQQVPADLFEFLHLVDEPYVDWLAENLAEAARVGYDPRLHPLSWQRRTLKTLKQPLDDTSSHGADQASFGRLLE